MDNSPNSSGKGTSSLRTECRQGQTINWLVYCINSAQSLNGTWPPLTNIINIVFVDKNDNAQPSEICSLLKPYGAPSGMLSPYTPVYNYWAGLVPSELEPGIYPYRLLLQLMGTPVGQSRFFELDGPSLHVVPIIS
jgi:hypothetical protein